MIEAPPDPIVARVQFWVGRPWPAGVYETGPTCRCRYAVWPHVDLQQVIAGMARPLPVRPGDWIVTHSSGRVTVEPS